MCNILTLSMEIQKVESKHKEALEKVIRYPHSSLFWPWTTLADYCCILKINELSKGSLLVIIATSLTFFFFWRHPDLCRRQWHLHRKPTNRSLPLWESIRAKIQSHKVYYKSSQCSYRQNNLCSQQIWFLHTILTSKLFGSPPGRQFKL